MRPALSERFIRHIWCRQDLDAASLTTVDGRRIEVLSPGILSTGAGPDIVLARLRIGGILYSGDIEVHQTASGWTAHGHQDNPAYNRVILHVVLEEGSGGTDAHVHSGRGVPVLVLGRFLARPPGDVWSNAVDSEREWAAELLPCSHQNASVDAGTLERWLTKLSEERLEFKIRRMEARLRELAETEGAVVREAPRTWGEIPAEGAPDEIPVKPEPTLQALSRKRLWEQLLYEGLFDALGFSRNRTSFVRLARSVPLRTICDLHLADDPMRLRAALFGAADLLPAPSSLTDRHLRHTAKQLRREWRKIKPHLRNGLLHRGDWVFSPMRPANLPPARLAAGAGLVEKIVRQDLFRAIVQGVKTRAPAGECRRHLESLLTVQTEPMGFLHTAVVRRRESTAAVLGAQRIGEMIVNVVVPLTLLYARMFHERDLRARTYELYRTGPAAASNAVTRRIDRQLLRGKVPLSTLPLQQGAIQLFRSYCLQHRCSDCGVDRALRREPTCP